MSAKTKQAKRFAKMLFHKTGLEKAEKIIQDLSMLRELIESDRNIRNFFLSPTFSSEDHLKGIEALSEKLSLDNDTKTFLIFLTEKRAVGLLPEILHFYINLYLEEKKKAKATVLTSLELTKEQKEMLLSALKALAGGRDVDVEYVYNPELIGGLVVKVGSIMYDTSLKGQLKVLKEEIIKG